MKRVLLAVLLFCSCLTLTSFGIIDNPKIAAQYQKNSGLSCNQNVVKLNLDAKSIKTHSENSEELKDESASNKSFFRAFFSIVYKAISEIVFALISK